MPPAEEISFAGDTLEPSSSARPLSFVTGLVIRWGLAKDEQSARYVLLGTALVAIVLAFIVPSLLGPSTGPRVPQATIDAAIAHPPASAPLP